MIDQTALEKINTLVATREKLKKAISLLESDLRRSTFESDTIRTSVCDPPDGEHHFRVRIKDFHGIAVEELSRVDEQLTSLGFRPS